jgi:uncharacterized protein with HEPN domain
MEHDPRTLLWDVRESAAAIARFIIGRTLEHYRADAMLRAAVERHFEIVGEALNRLSKGSLELAARVPDLVRAVAFRNLLIHGYAAVDDDVVWRTAQEDLPQLRQAVAELLAELGDAPDPAP